MAFFRVIVVCAMIGVGLSSAHAHAQDQPSRFDGWAAAIVSGDWTDSRGRPIEAFDNARRDLAQAFVQAGFDPALTVDYSLRPDRTPVTSAIEALEGIEAATARGRRGCLLYFTSHGTPEGIVFGPGRQIAPDIMANMVRQWCGERPTVVVVSACYSGVFLNALSGPNRMILTAAREDRTSFGCGADATYPYFDDCMLQGLGAAADFLSLAADVRRCVAERESREGLTPPSEPQVRVGANMQMLAPTLRFRARP